MHEFQFVTASTGSHYRCSNQALAQACAVCSLFLASMSEMGMLRQLSIFSCFLGRNRNYNPLRETFVYVVVALASDALWFRCGSPISFEAVLSACSLSGCPSSAPLGQFIRPADGPHRVWSL